MKKQNSFKNKIKSKKVLIFLFMIFLESIVMWNTFIPTENLKKNELAQHLSGQNENGTDFYTNHLCFSKYNDLREFQLKDQRNVKRELGGFDDNPNNFTSYFQKPVPFLDYSGVRSFLSESGNVYSVAFSPNDSIIAGTSGSTIEIWNMTLGKIINTLSGHLGIVYAVGYHPNGSILASASADKTIKVWNATTGSFIMNLNGHSDYVFTIAFSPNGRLLASASADKTIKIWNATTGSFIRTLTGHGDWVESVAFSSDEKLLGSASDDNTVRLWNVTNGSLIKTFTGHTGDVLSVTFSPDDSILASGGRDDVIRLWNLQSMTSFENLTGHTGDVLSVDFSPKRNLLASSSRDHLIKLWNVTTWSVIQNLTGHSNDIWSANFSPDSKLLISGSHDDTIKLWNLTLGSEIDTLADHTGWVYSVEYNPSGTILASGSVDNSVKLWNVSSGLVIDTLSGHSDWIYSVDFSPDGSILASASRDNTIKLWDVDTGTEIRTLGGHLSYVTSVSFNPNGTILASGSYDSTIKLWNVSSGTSIKTLNNHSDVINTVDFNPNGTILISGSNDDTLKLWNVSTGTVMRTLPNHAGNVATVKFGRNGEIIASGSYDNTIILWNVSTGGIIRTITGHLDNVRSLAFSPDNKVLATSSADQTIKFWNLSTGELIRPIECSNLVTSVSFSPDGRVLASSFRVTSSIKLWSAGNLMICFSNDVLRITTVNNDLSFNINSKATINASWDGNQFQDITGNKTLRTPSDFGFYNLSFEIFHFGSILYETYYFFIVESFDDYDGDGLPNYWEELYATLLLFNDASDDQDNDNLTNLGEFQAQTDPNSPDSDNDGWFDGSEVLNSSDPLDPNPPPFVNWSSSIPTLNNMVTNDSTLNWQINDTNATSIGLWVNQSLVTVQKVPFDWSINLAEGLNNITFLAFYDLQSNYSKRTFIITLDTILPTISLVNLNNGAVLKSNSEIVVNVEDQTEPLNYKYFWDEGTYHETSSLTFALPSPEGIHTLHLKVVDGAGNVNSTSFFFITDDTPPTATIQGITFLMSGKNTIRVIPEDENPIDRVVFELSGEIIASDDNAPYRWEWATTDTEDGIYQIRIKIYDAAGNEFVKTYQNIFVVNNPLKYFIQILLENYQLVLLIILAILIIIIIFMTRREIHILYLYANPKSHPLELDPEKEFNLIEEDIKKTKYRRKLFFFRRKIKMILRGALSRSQLPKRLADPEFKPHIVHFSGHGDSKLIQLMDDKDEKIADWVPLAPIIETFKLNKKRIKIVILNACYSKELAEGLKEHIDFVVGMTKEIMDAAAREFCIGFYTYLAVRKNIEEAFENGISRIELIKDYGGEIPQIHHREDLDPSKEKLF